MRRLSMSVAVALAVATMLLPATVLAGNQRPMSGSFTVGLVPAAPRCGPNALTIAVEGSGIGTHLGRFTGAGSNCTSFDLATSEVPISDGIALFVAADGSTITTHYQGTQHAPVAGVATTEVTHTVVGGTGRFTDASGVWASSGTIDFTTGLSSATVSGWLGY
jgi:hypothetical protein